MMKMTTMKQLLPHRNAQLIEGGTLWTEMCSDGRHPLHINLLKPNDIYMLRTAALTSRRCILYIYSTNTRTEYFKHAA